MPLSGSLSLIWPLILSPGSQHLSSEEGWDTSCHTGHPGGVISMATSLSSQGPSDSGAWTSLGVTVWKCIGEPQEMLAAS